jgi:uncharacterized 2Fe-2S/4Fe-4S cluster protein (DUF4445 family)
MNQTPEELINSLLESRCNQLRVTRQMIDDLIASSQTQEHIFWGKELLVSYQLECGFTVTGRAACIDPDNFDIEIGRLVAEENAKTQLWQLEGYRLNWDLYTRGVLVPD